MKNMIAKIGDWVKHHQYNLWLGACVVLVAWSAYGLGRLQGRQQYPVTVQNARVFQAGTAPRGTASRAAPAHTDLRVVVSRSSMSKKYHFTWCSGASKIKPENQLWFDTEQRAIAAGYTLAGNCAR